MNGPELMELNFFWGMSGNDSRFDTI